MTQRTTPKNVAPQPLIAEPPPPWSDEVSMSYAVGFMEALASCEGYEWDLACKKQDFDYRAAKAKREHDEATRAAELRHAQAIANAKREAELPQRRNAEFLRLLGFTVRLLASVSLAHERNFHAYDLIRELRHDYKGRDPHYKDKLDKLREHIEQTYTEESPWIGKIVDPNTKQLEDTAIRLSHVATDGSRTWESNGVLPEFERLGTLLLDAIERNRR